MELRLDKETFIGDIFGGLAAVLVALPSAIAYGLVIYGPLGTRFGSQAVIAGIIGTIALGLIPPLFGGTVKLVSAPCAPAAAVLSVFVAETMKRSGVQPVSIPIYLMLVAGIAGIIQLIVGKLGAGNIIKYIPYPVVAGYLSGVGILIIKGQLPKFFGFPKEAVLWKAMTDISLWKVPSIIIGVFTILVMVYSVKLTQKIPAAIMALLGGVTAYGILAIFIPELRMLGHNKFIIGPIQASIGSIGHSVWINWQQVVSTKVSDLIFIIVPMLTLAVLLSIDTLKTCVVLDALTQSRHDSNKELVGQGLGNFAVGLLGGVPGAGTMGPTLVNLSSGGKTRLSGFFVGIFAVFILLLLSPMIAWIPVAALAGILFVVGFRMIDKKSIDLLKSKTTVLDFLVILAVVISAISLSLIAAAGVGIAMSIVLFLREQMKISVIRRKAFGNQVSSKKKRPISEMKVLEEHGKRVLLLELQGQLFFGTADQLMSELEPYIDKVVYLILDMRHVQAIDFTAANRLNQIYGRIKKHNGYLILSTVSRTTKNYLQHVGIKPNGMDLYFIDSLDEALERCEEKWISKYSDKFSDREKVLNLSEIDLFSDIPENILQHVQLCLKEKEYEPGDMIFRQSEQSNEIYFIRKGTVKIELSLSTGPIHLTTFVKGDFFGDMSFLDHGIRSANAFAAEHAKIFVLPRREFDELVKVYPEVGNLFFERLAYAISYRLRQMNVELSALQGE